MTLVPLRATARAASENCAPAPHDPASLQDARAELDRIDDQLLDLVERRLSAATAIARLKDGERAGLLRLRPAREAEVIARLTARAAAAPPRLVADVWRTLMAWGLEGQGGTQIVVAGDAADPLALHEAVRARFGPAAAIRWARSADEALGEALAQEAVAVIAAPAPPAVSEPLRVFDRVGVGGSVDAWAIGRVSPADVAPDIGR